MRCYILILLIFFSLSCYSQSEIEVFAVKETCKDLNTNQETQQQYELVIYPENNDSIFVRLNNDINIDGQVFNEECRYFYAKFHDDKSFEILPNTIPACNADFKGTGTRTANQLSLNYIVTYTNGTEGSCTIQNTPLLYYNFDFSTHKIWSYQIIGNDSKKNILYRLSDSDYDTELGRELEKSNDNGISWSSVGYINSGNPVYFQSSKSTSRILLYDFDLQKGDVFNQQEVLSIDTIECGIVKKKRISFSDDIWIEGIGSIFYPYFDLDVMGTEISQSNLLYVQYDHRIYPYDGRYIKYSNYADFIWQNPQMHNLTFLNELTEFHQVSIFPNPVKDKLTLTLSQAENEIKIFDLQGKLWLQQKGGFSAEINVSMLPAGTYMLVVNGKSYKFVKE